jgi:hypothetical protein
VQDPHEGTAIDGSKERRAIAASGISCRDVLPVYFSTDPYHSSFDERLDMRRYHAYGKRAGGMICVATGDRLTLKDVVASSPAARIRAWRTRIRGAWLRKVGGTPVTTEEDVVAALELASAHPEKECMLTFSHPEVRQGLTCGGIPQVNLDQMNPRRMMDPSFYSVAMEAEKARGVFFPDRPHNGLLKVQESGGVLNYITSAMKLTRGKLLQGPEWTEWHKSEWKQLDQYEAQGMFGEPIKIKSMDTVFRLVWTYNVNALDQRKKARCACDGSIKAGQV